VINDGQPNFAFFANGCHLGGEMLARERDGDFEPKILSVGSGHSVVLLGGRCAILDVNADLSPGNFDIFELIGPHDFLRQQT
jgi:hypothetical protein